MGGGPGVVAGIVAFSTVYLFDTGTSADEKITVRETGAAIVPEQKATVVLDPSARQVAGRFILTAVAREHLAESYELTHPELRQGMSLKEWETGNIPVQYYPADAIDTATFKIDESHADKALLEGGARAQGRRRGETADLFIGLKKVKGKWLVDYWGAAYVHRGPGDERLEARGVPGRLSSPRFRRRALRLSGLAVVAGAAAVVAVLFWNTGRDFDTPVRPNEPGIVPEVKQNVALSVDERRQVLDTAARFVRTAVRRERTVESFELVSARIAQRVHAPRVGERDIPVQPYPVDAARWKMDYTYGDEVGLSVYVIRGPGEALSPMVFLISLTRAPSGAWLVRLLGAEAGREPEFPRRDAVVVVRCRSGRRRGNDQRAAAGPLGPHVGNLARGPVRTAALGPRLRAVAHGL